MDEQRSPSAGRRTTDTDRFSRLESDVRAVAESLAAHLEQERHNEMQAERLVTELAVLTAQVTTLSGDVRAQQITVAALTSVIDRARGGWAAMVLMGGVIGTVAGAFAWLWDQTPWAK